MPGCNFSGDASFGTSLVSHPRLAREFTRDENRDEDAHSQDRCYKRKSSPFLLPLDDSNQIVLPIHLSHSNFINMPPPKSRPQPDDSRSETSSTKEKLSTSGMPALNGKGRRMAGSTAVGSSLRDVITAAPNSTTTAGYGPANSDSNPGVSMVVQRRRE